MKNVDKLKAGQEFSNYKELCNFLEEDIKGGDSKKKQLKDWERYFDYNKNKNMFIINKIYDKPITKDWKTKKGEKYANNIGIIVLDMLARKGGEIISTKMTLYEEIAMTNSRYKTKDLSDFPLEIIPDNTEFGVNLFFEFSNKKLLDMLASSLNILQKNKLIEWYITFNIKRSEHQLRVATPDERRQINGIIRKICYEMNCENLYNIYQTKREKEYYTKLDIKLQKEMQIVYCENVVQIIPNNIPNIYTELDIINAKEKLNVNILNGMVGDDKGSLMRLILNKNKRAYEKFIENKEKNIENKNSTPFKINDNTEIFTQYLAEYFVNKDMDSLTKKVENMWK